MEQLFDAHINYQCYKPLVEYCYILHQLDMDNALILTPWTKRINGTSSIKQTVSEAWDKNIEIDPPIKGLSRDHQLISGDSDISDYHGDPRRHRNWTLERLFLERLSNDVTQSKKHDLRFLSLWAKVVASLRFDWYSILVVLH